MDQTDQKRSGRHLEILRRIARRAMIERGFLPDFSARVNSELAGLKAAPVPDSGSVRDLRDLPWCSIDNDESRDLDQLTVVREGAKEAVTISRCHRRCGHRGPQRPGHRRSRLPQHDVHLHPRPDLFHDSRDALDGSHLPQRRRGPRGRRRRDGRGRRRRRLTAPTSTGPWFATAQSSPTTPLRRGWKGRGPPPGP